MKTIILTALMSTALLDAAFAERLDKRFGDDLERGYRSEREFDGGSRQFRNRDRANFLGAKPKSAEAPAFPKQDLQAPARMGLQR